MRISQALAGLVAVAATVTSATAIAQTKLDSYEYHIEDDELWGETFGEPPPLLQLPPRGRRVLLIRPRVSFVAELAASVERL
jgi:hypothetical protein